MGPLYHSKCFRIPFRLIPSLPSVPIRLSQSSFPLLREEIKTLLQKPAVEKVQDPGTPGFYSRLLLPTISCTEKEWKVRSSNRSFFTKHIYKETTIQDGDSQVDKTVDCDQRLGCLHRFDRCLPSCSNLSAIQKVSSVHLRRSDIPIHSLTLWNVPKSVDFTKLMDVIASHLCQHAISVFRT